MAAIMNPHDNRNRDSRRQLLRILGAGVAAMTLPNSMPAYGVSSILRKIPKSGEAVPVGGKGLFGDYSGLLYVAVIACSQAGFV